MLTVNIKKSKVMLYHSFNQGNMLLHKDVCLNGVNLEVVEKFTYLGIRLDPQLSFNSHVEHLYQSAVNMIFTLKYIRPYIDRNTALIIAKAHILSRLEYGSLFCIGSSMGLLKKLQVLLNRTLRICLKLPRTLNVFAMHACGGKYSTFKYSKEYCIVEIDVYGFKIGHGSTE